jgi:hypothetical protein
MFDVGNKGPAQPAPVLEINSQGRALAGGNKWGKAARHTRYTLNPLS